MKRLHCMVGVWVYVRDDGLKVRTAHELRHGLSGLDLIKCLFDNRPGFRYRINYKPQGCPQSISICCTEQSFQVGDVVN